MKKLFLTVIVSLAFCGAIFAQHTSFWNDFSQAWFEGHNDVVSFIKIDGVFVETDFHWADLEIASFSNGECRGHAFMINDPADDHPSVQIPVYVNPSDVGNPVIFNLYDHTTGIEYTACTTYISGTEGTVVTGQDYIGLWWDPDLAVVLDFTTPPTFTKDIAGYTTLTNPAGGYYLLASPVRKMDPEFVNDMLSNEYDLYWFNQSGDSEGHQWMNYKAESFFLERGKGYLYANSQDVTLSFTGTPLDNGTDVTIPLDYDAAAPFDMAGTNLIGNPFTVTAYVSGRPFYVMNTEGTEIVAAGGTSVPPMEGIFVHAQAEGESVTFTTTDPGKGSSAILNLSQGRGVIDRAIVSFDDNGNLPKFQINPNSTKLYIPQDDNDYAVVNSQTYGELPVNFKAESDGSYILDFAANNAEFDYCHLIDNKTGNNVDLLDTPSYSFDAQTTDYASRFRFVYSKSTTGVDENFAFISDGSLIVNGDGTLQIVDLMGRVVSTNELSTTNCQLPTVNTLAAGVYTLRLITNDGVKSQKIVVK